VPQFRCNISFQMEKIVASRIRIFRRHYLLSAAANARLDDEL